MDEERYEPADGAETPHDDDVSPDAEETAAEKIKKLRAELKEAKEKAAEYLAGWQRAKADYINQERAEAAWKKEYIEFANRNLIDELLPVINHFLVAFSNKEAWEKVDRTWRMGIEYIYKQLLGILEGHGLVLLGEVGEHFDPALHNAVSTEETGDAGADDTIARVLEPGFRLKDKVLRPARVVVYKHAK